MLRKLVVGRMCFRWTLVVNVRTAKTIGLTLSPQIISRAQQVIE